MLQLTQCPSCHKPLKTHPIFPKTAVWCYNHGDFFLYQPRGKDPEIIFRPFRGRQRAYKKRPPRPALLDEMGIPVRTGIGRPKQQIRCEQNDTVYPSIGEAARILGIRQSEISKNLNGKRHHVGGYTFVRINDDGTGNLVEIPRPPKIAGPPRRMVAVRCNETGQEFESMSEASRVLGIGKGNIVGHIAGLTGRRTVGGYTFSRVSQKKHGL